MRFESGEGLLARLVDPSRSQVRSDWLPAGNVGSHGRSPPHEDQSLEKKKSVFIFNSLNGPNLCYTVRFCLVLFYMNEINTCSMFSHIMCLWRASDRMSRDPQATCCNIGWRCEAAAIYLLFKSSLVTVINFFKGYLASLFIIAAVASFY